MDAALLHGFDLFGCRPFSARNDCAGMSHASARRRRTSSDKSHHGLLHVFFDIFCSFFFSGPADFSHHDNRFGFGFH